MNFDFAIPRARCLRALAALASKSAWEPSITHWHATQVDRHFNALLRLQRRMGKPNERGTHVLRDRILTGFSGLLCAYLQEAHNRGLKTIKPVSPKRLEQLVRSVRPTKRIFDYAVLKPEEKADGTKRIIISPGPKIRRAQRLVSDVLDASAVDNPFDYNCAGRGQHAAVAEVIRLVEEKGIRDFVEFDLENHFTSVDAKHLKGVPLPKKVIRHAVLFNRYAILLHNKTHTAEAEAARHGLPQGARVSGQLASSLLGRELRHLDGAMGIVTFVDDGVIGACDPAGAKSLAEAIKLRFGNLPGGPLGFKRLDVRSIEQGFQFLGYYLRLDAFGEQPKVYVQPSHEAWEKFSRRLKQKLRKMSPVPDWENALKIALAYWDRWRRSFLLWHPIPEKLDEAAFRVECLVSDFLSAAKANY